jgi:hypothetical protein
MIAQQLPFSFGVKVGKWPSVKFWLLARNVSKYCIGNLHGKTGNVPFWPDLTLHGGAKLLTFSDFERQVCGL